MLFLVLRLRCWPVAIFLDEPRRTLGCGKHPVGFLVVDELLRCWIPPQCAFELLGNAAQQKRAGGSVRDVRVANRFFPRADALKKISGMAGTVIDTRLD